MSLPRSEIAAWIAQGHLAPDARKPALRAAGVLPQRQDWRLFLDRLALWMGVVLCSAGVIFFIAYNWQAMGRFAKFALAEVLLLAAVLAAVWRGLHRSSGQAAMCAAALLTGALLALVGQTYQTGADNFELFAAWTAATAIWVLVARSGVLWMFWLGLINLSAILYFQTFPGILGIVFSSKKLLWTLLIFDSAALCLWEWVARGRLLSARWPQRLLALASGAAATMVGLWGVSAAHPGENWADLAAYGAWLVLAYLLYRRLIPDLFALAGAVLSVIIVSAGFMARHLFPRDAAGAFFVIGLAVILMSALGALWLRRIAAEGRPA